VQALEICQSPAVGGRREPALLAPEAATIVASGGGGRSLRREQTSLAQYCYQNRLRRWLSRLTEQGSSGDRRRESSRAFLAKSISLFFGNYLERKTQLLWPQPSPSFCCSSLQLFRSTTPTRIDSGRTCSTGAWSKVPYKLRMTSSTWLFSYELCSCRSSFPSCNQGYPHHPVHARKPHQTRTHGWTRRSRSGCRTVVTLLLRDCSRIFGGPLPGGAASGRNESVHVEPSGETLQHISAIANNFASLLTEPLSLTYRKQHNRCASGCNS
jgi:hypothetical protein